MQNKQSVTKISIIAIFAVLISVSLVSSAVRIDTFDLREAVTVEGVRAHQAAFQDAADDNGGTRESSTLGYFDSVDYVAETMEAAGYDVVVK